MDYQQRALQRIKANIDFCWPHIEAGAEAILMSASGCTVMLKDYAHLLQDDKEYADKARQIADKIIDIVEVLDQEDLSVLRPPNLNKTIAYHSPCTQQHGLMLPTEVKTLLFDVGFRLVQTNNTHLCCGSAGTYSLLNSTISNQLRDNKLAELQRHKPDIIATANIGCLLHLTAKAEIPVVHWIQLLDQHRIDK
jgi:glycolate oxidase iron-sulfur subunit